MAFRRFFYTILDWPCSPSKGGAALDSRRSAISSSSVNCFMCGHCVLRSIWIPVASDLSEKPIKFAGLEAPKLSWGLEFPGLSIISTRVQKAGKSKSETCSASLTTLTKQNQVDHTRLASDSPTNYSAVMLLKSSFRL